jgi:hypothetical protein
VSGFLRHLAHRAVAPAAIRPRIASRFERMKDAAAERTEPAHESRGSRIAPPTEQSQGQTERNALRATLPGAPGAVDLPTDTRSPPRQSAEILNRGLPQALRDLARATIIPEVEASPDREDRGPARSPHPASAIPSDVNRGRREAPTAGRAIDLHPTSAPKAIPEQLGLPGVTGGHSPLKSKGTEDGPNGATYPRGPRMDRQHDDQTVDEWAPPGGQNRERPAGDIHASPPDDHPGHHPRPAGILPGLVGLHVSTESQERPAPNADRPSLATGSTATRSEHFDGRLASRPIHHEVSDMSQVPVRAVAVRPRSAQANEPGTSDGDQIAEPEVPANVTVTIGRIEVRAVVLPAEPPAVRRPKSSVMTLDDYLRRRTEGA